MIRQNLVITLGAKTPLIAFVAGIFLGQTPIFVDHQFCSLEVGRATRRASRAELQLVHGVPLAPQSCRCKSLCNLLQLCDLRNQVISFTYLKYPSGNKN